MMQLSLIGLVALTLAQCDILIPEHNNFQEGPMATTRQPTQDANAARAQNREQAQMIQQVDTFAPDRSQIVGNYKASNEILDTVLKFGTDLALKDMEKKAASDYLMGQAARAVGDKLSRTAAPPTRKGFQAMDVKLESQAWFAAQKATVDAGDNMLEPTEYTAGLRDQFNAMLTGDRDTDMLKVQTLLPVIDQLSEYQTAAFTKKRLADSTSQHVMDVRTHLELMAEAAENGDIATGAAQSDGLNDALATVQRMPAELQPELYKDLAIMGFDLGSPQALQWARDNGIPFNAKQEQAIRASEAKFNKSLKTRQSIKHENALVQLDLDLSNADSLESINVSANAFREEFGDRHSDEWFANKRIKAIQAFNKSAGSNVLTDAVLKGEVAAVSAKPAQRQAAMQTVFEETLKDTTLAPEQAQAKVEDLIVKNGIVYDQLKVKLGAGLKSPVSPEGKVNDAFVKSLGEFNSLYTKDAKMALDHIKDDETKAMILSIKTLSERSGYPLEEAIVLADEQRKNAKLVQPEDRKDVTTELKDAVQSYMGDSFFSVRNFTDTVSITDEVVNKNEITNSVNAMARILHDANPGAEPEAIAEMAINQYKNTHEQIGNSMVYTAGKSMSDRLGVPKEYVNDAYDFAVQQVRTANPDWQGDIVVLGNPVGEDKGGSLVLGNRDPDTGMITGTGKFTLAEMGTMYNDGPLKEIRLAERTNVIEAEKEARDRTALVKNAQDNLGLTKQQADAASTNWLNRWVLSKRVGAATADATATATAERNAAYMAESVKGNAEATAAYEEFKSRFNITHDDQIIPTETARAALEGEHGVLSNEQQQALDNGDMSTYQALRYKDVVPDTTGPTEFISSVRAATTDIVAGTGIFPEVAIAQAALETGYGGSVAGDNFFGIKGKGQTFTTHEEIDGKMVKMQDSFEVHTGYAGSVRSYVDFLQRNPRYMDALSASTPQEQAKALQEAGYATDSEYANKLISIMKRI